MSPPRVSVIICVYNRAIQVVTCLERLLRMEGDGVEIVLVDDGSTDDTPARLEQFRQEKRGFYLGRDLIFMAAALFTLPLGLVDWRLLALPAVCVLLQLAAMAYNEIFLKGKSVLEAVIVLPACWFFNTVKLWHVLRMLLRIAAGREPGIRSAKRQWRARLRGLAASGSGHGA